MPTYFEATDQMFSLVNLAWNSNSISIVGYIPVMYWPGHKEDQTVNGGKFWSRVSRKTVLEEQTTLATKPERDRGVRFTNHGIITVQIFCPMSTANSYNLGARLAEMIKNTLRGRSTSGQVWFKDAYIDELPIKEMFYRLNVVATYQYDDMA